MWSCPSCTTKLDDGFEVCWACGTSADGAEDPGFVTADEAMPEVTLEPSTDVDGWADLFGPELPEGPERPLNLVDCYRGRDMFDAHLVVGGLMERGIPAIVENGSYRAGFGVAGGGALVRVRAQDLGRARAWIDAMKAERESGR